MTISFNELKKELKRILLKLSFAEKKAEMCADIFASNSRDGTGVLDPGFTMRLFAWIAPLRLLKKVQ